MPGSLIIRFKGLGDIVHVLPILQMLRTTRPDEPLGFLCQRPFGEIIPKSLGVKVFELRPGASFYETLALVRRVRQERYERLFDLFCNPRTALFSLLSGIPFRAGFNYRIRRWAYHATFAPPDPNLHLSALFGEFMEHFGYGGPLQPPKLEWPKEAENLACHILHGHGQAILGINPHTTYPSKAWPIEHFRELCRRWHAFTGQPVLIFWGPGEEKKTQRLIADLGQTRAFTHPALTIPQFVALLSKVDLFVTGDTGPMNIAWALGIPTVALFGPTTRRAVAPRGEKHLVLHHPNLDCLECHREVCSDGRCMRELTPDLVWDKIWAKYSRPSIILPPEAGKQISFSAREYFEQPVSIFYSSYGNSSNEQQIKLGYGSENQNLKSITAIRKICTPAVFLDRDGTLNPDPGYISSPEGFSLFPDVGRQLARLRRAGYLLVLVTNQSGVSRGLIAPEALGAIHSKLQALLAKDGAALDAIYVCPHHPAFPVETAPNLCICRKPAPGLIFQAASDLNIDLSKSFAIGDRLSDAQMAINAGVKPILIGNMLDKMSNFPDIVNVKTLEEAVNYILRAKNSDL